MQTADVPRFHSVIASMCRVFGVQSDRVLLDAYWLALKSWPLEEFEQAAAHLLGKCQFMPKPADFNTLRKANNPTAGEAFHKAMLLARRAPPRELASLRSGDDAIDAAVRAIGGYTELGNCESGKLHFLERRFAEHYEAIGEVQQVRNDVPMLGGSMAAISALAESKRIVRA